MNKYIKNALKKDNYIKKTNLKMILNVYKIWHNLVKRIKEEFQSNIKNLNKQ